MSAQRAIKKFPRTPHLTGSAFQVGDHDLLPIPFAQLRNHHLVVEEKIDGANSGISFTEAGVLRLQSRGHYLTGGGRERHFAQFKSWASAIQYALWPVLSDRYIVYGEWMYARHTIFYDALEHYFLEFDVLDRHTGLFLSTEHRRALLNGLPICSVPVLHEGTLRSPAQLTALLGQSRYRTPRWREALRTVAEKLGQDADRILRETDPSEQMEGLYIKIEDGGQVRGRYKMVRADFHDIIAAAGGHWHDRPILPNQLAEGVSLYGPG